MKNTINTFFLVIFFISLNAQVKIGDNPNNFNNDAMLEIESSNKGLLIPRVTLSTTDAATPLTSHVEGMVVYNLTTNVYAIPDPIFEGLYYNNGTKWIKMLTLGGTGASGGDGDAWGVNGEDVTSPISRNGYVGLGILSPRVKLDIAANSLDDQARIIIENDYARPSISFWPTKNTALNPFYPQIDHTWDIYPQGISAGSSESIFKISRRNAALTQTNFFTISSAMGHVGIGTWKVTNMNNWEKILEVYNPGNCKILASIGGSQGGADLRTGIFSHYGAWGGHTLTHGVVGTESNHPLAFITNYYSRMFITTDGNVGISDNNPVARLVVKGQKPTFGVGTGVNCPGGTGITTCTGTIGSGSSDGPSQAIIAEGFNGQTYLNDWPLGWHGGLATYDVIGNYCFFTNYVQRSDAKLKKDILSMNIGIMDKLMALRPVTYLLKEQSAETEGTQYGFIAQEVREIFPSIVTKTSDELNGTIGMNYSALIAPTIYVVQQQQKMIEDLKRENEEIKVQLKLILESIKK